jgi:hypothetical protein
MTENDKKGKALVEYVKQDLDLPGSDELAKYSKGIGKLVYFANEAWRKCPDEQKATFAILFTEKYNRLKQKIQDYGIEKWAEEIGPVEGKIENMIDTIVETFNYVCPSEEKVEDRKLQLEFATDTAVTSLRLLLKASPSQKYQKIVSGILADIGDISDVIGNDWYLGHRSDDFANGVINEYFDKIPFAHSESNITTSQDPVGYIFRDWSRAVDIAKSFGVDEDAFLPDGVNLFKFAPDTLIFVKEHPELFPDLDITKVNNGAYVEAWLKNTSIDPVGGPKGEYNLHDGWLVLLTGYTPEDNKSIEGLYDRYNKMFLMTALHVHQRR